MAARLLCSLRAATTLVPRRVLPQQLGRPWIVLPDRQQQRAAPHSRPASTSTSAAASTLQETAPVVFTGYTFYKGKSAMKMDFIKPTWEPTASGNGISVKQEGRLLLQFANALGERTYDWRGAQSVALSAVECAELLEKIEAGESVDKFHDPNMRSSEQGTITKAFKAQKVQQPGYFFSLSVNDKNAKSEFRCSMGLSPAELRLVTVLLNWAIPHLLGFNELFHSVPKLESGGYNDSAGPPF